MVSKRFPKKKYIFFVHQNIVIIFAVLNFDFMKKVSILIVSCFAVGMLLSSCGSSKPCPAYRQVDPRARTMYIELPAVEEAQLNS